MENQTLLLKAPKTNWKYIIIIVILAGIVIGGIFGYQWWLAKKEIKTLEKTRTESFIWKTYTDEKNKYEVKYPDNWRVEVIEKTHEMAIGQGLVRWYPPWVSRGKIDTVIEVNMINKQEGYSTSMILFGKEITCENVEIGDLIFCKLVKKPEKANVMDIISYSLSKNDKIYTVAIYHDLPESEIQIEFEIFNQMLSTFRFIEVRDGTCPFLSYEEAIQILNNGQAESIFQHHDLRLIMLLKDDRCISTKQLVIDDILQKIEECGDLCKDVIFGTE